VAVQWELLPPPQPPKLAVTDLCAITAVGIAGQGEQD
jgi:hypothetical protein